MRRTRLFIESAGLPAFPRGRWGRDHGTGFSAVSASRGLRRAVTLDLVRGTSVDAARVDSTLRPPGPRARDELEVPGGSDVPADQTTQRLRARLAAEGFAHVRGP